MLKYTQLTKRLCNDIRNTITRIGNSLTLSETDLRMKWTNIAYKIIEVQMDLDSKIEHCRNQSSHQCFSDCSQQEQDKITDTQSKLNNLNSQLADIDTKLRNEYDNTAILKEIDTLLNSMDDDWYYPLTNNMAPYWICQQSTWDLMDKNKERARDIYFENVVPMQSFWKADRSKYLKEYKKLKKEADALLKIYDGMLNDLNKILKTKGCDTIDCCDYPYTPSLTYNLKKLIELVKE